MRRRGPIDSGADPSLQGAADRHRALVQESLLPARRARVDAVVSQRMSTLTVVLERLRDPHNQAAVLRTAEALGILTVHVVEAPDAPFQPHRKVSVDADKWLRVQRHPTPEACVDSLRAAGFLVCCGTLDPKAVPLYDLDVLQPCAFVFGNEHRGVSAETRRRADRLFRIPMRGFVESFNVSVAAALTLFHAVRTRELAGRPTDLGEQEREALRARYELRSLNQYGRLMAVDRRAESRAARAVEEE